MRRQLGRAPALGRVVFLFLSLFFTLLSLGACSQRDAAEFGDQDGLRVLRWLTCEECTDGELVSVVDTVGDIASGALQEALMGPPQDYVDNARQALGAAWDRREAPGVSREEYVDAFLANYVATMQRRAAVALGELGRVDILEEAFENRDLIALRPDVEAVIVDLLVAAGTSTPGLTPPIATSVVVRPNAMDVIVGTSTPVEVLVLDGTGRMLDQDVSWSSSDPAIANILLGPRRSYRVNGETLGTAVLRATAGSASGQTTVTVTPPPGPPGVVRIALGDAQIDTVTNALPQPLVVEVLDETGTEVSGIAVNFQVSRGDATPADTTIVTDATGRASLNLTLGDSPGVVWVDATASGLPAPGPWPRTTVRFQIRAVPS